MEAPPVDTSTIEEFVRPTRMESTWGELDRVEEPLSTQNDEIEIIDTTDATKSSAGIPLETSSMFIELPGLLHSKVNKLDSDVNNLETRVGAVEERTGVHPDGKITKYTSLEIEPQKTSSTTNTPDNCTTTSENTDNTHTMTKFDVVNFM